jgi:hypothetical protein
MPDLWPSSHFKMTPKRFAGTRGSIQSWGPQWAKTTVDITFAWNHF